jgi:hypothetical protein
MWPKDGVDYPLTKGDYVFKECYFENFIDANEGFTLGEEATMTVTECIYNNCWWSLYFTANYNSRIDINNNIFLNSTLADVTIEDQDWGFIPNTEIYPVKRCSYFVTGNQFNNSTTASIVVGDYYSVIDPEIYLPLLVTIKGNLFNMNGTGTGVNALNSQDIVIRNNRFRGTCSTGVYVDGVAAYDATGKEYPAPFANNALILGNNLNGLKATTASVVLGEKSMNCTVIGTGNEKVIDNGVNNKVTAMKMVPGGHHFGPTIRDNLRMWHGRGHR